MVDEREYFHIEIEMLGADRTFPFHLYIYNPMSRSYSPILYANSPLIPEKEEFFLFVLERGGKLAVSLNQKLTFLKATGLSADDVPGLQQPKVHDLEIEREKKKEALFQEQNPFHFGEELKKGINANDFMAIINRVREESQILSVKVSPTVSLARYLCEKLLTKDNHTNRIVAVSFMLAKNCDMRDDEALGDLICAAFFAHIGQTQLDFSFSHRPLYTLGDDEKKKYRKHPGLAHHLIRKSQVQLSDRAKKIIEEHHERYDGSGYPGNKMGQFLDPLSLILGAVAHIFEFSFGMITGNKQPLSSTIRNLKDKTPTPGLEFEFGDIIYENLIHLVNTNLDESEKAA